MKIMPLETGIINQEFVCVDSESAIIENELQKYTIPVRYRVYIKDGLKKYRILYLKFNKKYTASIIGILGTVKNKFLLTGYGDYDEVSFSILKDIFKDSKDTDFVDVPDAITNSMLK